MEKPLKSSQPRYDIEGRYMALLKAGEALLCDSYDHAQPQLIAKNAGVSVGLFYRHFESKRDLLTAIMIYRLAILHDRIIQEIKKSSNPIDALQTVLVLTLQYFHTHQGLIKLFFMQIGYGDAVDIQKLQESRQTYRDILESILQSGITKGFFLALDTLGIQIAINSIIGTINWSLYDLLIVKGENIEPDKLAQKLSVHILRSLKS